jgi:hypothetical protein
MDLSNFAHYELRLQQLASASNNVDDRLSGISIYEGILPKLIVLELTQDPAGVSTPISKPKTFASRPSSQLFPD